MLWVSIYIKNHCPAEVLARFSALPSGSVAMSVITYGEQTFGAEKSAKSLAAQQILPQLTALIPVLPLDENASLHYGKIRQYLQAQGTPIGNNDLWIAAHALAKNLILVTEFERVPALQVENWVGI